MSGRGIQRRRRWIIWRRRGRRSTGSGRGSVGEWLLSLVPRIVFGNECAFCLSDFFIFIFSIFFLSFSFLCCVVFDFIRKFRYEIRVTSLVWIQLDKIRKKTKDKLRVKKRKERERERGLKKEGTDGSSFWRNLFHFEFLIFFSPSHLWLSPSPFPHLSTSSSPPSSLPLFSFSFPYWRLYCWTRGRRELAWWERAKTLWKDWETPQILQRNIRFCFTAVFLFSTIWKSPHAPAHFTIMYSILQNTRRKRKDLLLSFFLFVSLNVQWTVNQQKDFLLSLSFSREFLEIL